jgi:hypothetical protein
MKKTQQENTVQIETLRKQFNNPSNEFRTLHIIHGFDYLGSDEKTIRQRLEALRAMGIGGVVCNVSFRDYMRSKKQWQIFLKGISIAEQLGFRLWLYDEEGYPSGAAGGLVLERNPEWEAIGLVRRVDQNDKVHYTVKRMYKGTHCTENFYQKRHHPNILNADAVRAFISVTHKAYAKRISNLGKRIYAFFTDEPSPVTTYVRPYPKAIPALPWVEDLPYEFKKRKGYELEAHLEGLFRDVGDYPGVRCDFYEVISQLLAERYFGQIQTWCHEHNIASSGHMLAEESLVWHAMYYGDFFTCLKRMDIPSIDMLTSDPKTIVNGKGFMVPKYVSSAAHLIPLQRDETMSETSAFEEQRFKKRVTLKNMKATASILHLLGINTITSYYGHPHGTQQEQEDYASYNTYVGRLGVMLRNAQHVCDVAVMYPIAGILANFYPTALSHYQPHPNKRLREIDEQFVRLCRCLLQHQIDFDIVDESAIQHAKMERGRFFIAKERYRVLIIPDTDAVHLATLQSIAVMLEKGITVLAVGKLPRFAASRNENNRKVETLSAQLFRDNRLLPHADDRFIQALHRAGCNEISVEPSNPNLWVAHYLRGNRHIYFAVNVSARPIQCTLTLPKHKDVALWLPETGEIKKIKT